MIEAEIGTVVKGREIVKTPARRYIRSLCQVCGVVWGGDYSHVNGGAFRYCRPCSKQNFSLRARVNNRRPQPQNTADDDFVHHWMIAEAAGAKSDGICKKCGKEKAFNNSVEAEGVQHISLISRGPEDARYLVDHIRRENDSEF